MTWGWGQGSTTGPGGPGRVSPRKPGTNEELTGGERVCPEGQGPARGHTGWTQALDWDECHSRSFPPFSRGQNLFDSIKSEPFSIPEDDGNDLTHTFFNPDREGWLLKLGENVLMHAGGHAPTCLHTHATRLPHACT